MKTLKVKTTLITEMLGTASADKELHETFIAMKSSDKDLIKEELAALGAEELIEKALTIHYRDDDGDPMIWDYMVRGFLKAALQAKVEAGPIVIGKKKIKISKYNCKRIIDNLVFVTPRKIKLKFDGPKKLEKITRPLRAETMRGDRVALSTSEMVPAGATSEFTIHCMEDDLENLIRELLNYGQWKGFGQWRNANYGSFTWEEIPSGYPRKIDTKLTVTEGTKQIETVNIANKIATDVHTYLITNDVVAWNDESPSPDRSPFGYPEETTK